MKTKPFLYSLGTAFIIVSTWQLNGCHGRSGPGAPPPTPEVNILAKGGDGGDMGGAGQGNQIEFFKRVGSGPVEVRTEGSVDASFEPFMPTANLGTNPAVVTTDTTVSVLANEPAAGTLYFQINNSTLFLSDGDTTPFNAEEVVTGLHIEQDIVLTLELNANVATRATINLQNDLLNQGTIETVNVDATQRGNLSLNVSSYFANSEIDAAGRVEGQNGGDVDINAIFSIVNHGGINTSGADNSNGNAGDGGNINMNANQFSVETTGVLDSSGGNSTTADGGSGNGIFINSEFGIRNSGDLTTRGGDGITNAGGAGSVNFNVNQAGDIINDAGIDARGGLATQGNGGFGSPIDMNTRGGKLLSNGDLITRGGDTQQTSGFASAGGGGPINIRINGLGSSPAGQVNSGDIQLSGNIDSSGGNAPVSGDGFGGNAGNIQIENNSQCCDFFNASQKISLLGYALIDTSGGDALSGGSGGRVAMENTADSSSPVNPIPAGNIINEARIDTSGGDVLASVMTSNNGGCAGDVRFDTRSDPINSNSPDGTGVDNSGDITARSGENNEANGSTGCGGEVRFDAYSHINNTGNIDSSGGNDRGTDGVNTGFGNDGLAIFMHVFNGPLSNTGAITGKGGDGEFRGGNPGFIFEVRATSVDTSGDIDFSGGDADAALLGSVGGDGAEVNIFGSDGLGSVVNAGTTNVDGGTGETPGVIGRHIEGGFCIQGSC